MEVLQAQPEAVAQVVPEEVRACEVAHPEEVHLELLHLEVQPEVYLVLLVPLWSA